MRSRLVDLYRSEKQRPDFSINESDFGELPDQPVDFEAQLESERRQAIFLWAAKRVREEVQPATWEAFWRAGVSGENVDAVARALGMSRGAVYVAKSRVMSRLRQAVQDHLTDSEVVAGVSS
jgi:RNA polymerase sigma-70 factor (ECF subfamily)